MVTARIASRLVSILIATGIGVSALAQIQVPSNGSSGPFSPTGSTYVVDLSLAKTGKWDDPNVGPDGVYDPEKWAIVFHYTEVNIPSGTTVTFKNHPKNPPVVWLVQGNVTINGVMTLNGTDGWRFGTGNLAVPGPGGFRGGAGNPGGGLTYSGGFGAGGARQANHFSGGSHGTKGNADSGPIYNHAGVLPLVGGSGGGGRSDYDDGGGAGGGAVLIAASNSIIVNGRVDANGGSRVDRSGGGSGGAIRLVSNVLTGSGAGLIRALGGDNTGGHGRIRLESNTFTFNGNVNPPPSSIQPGAAAQIWPEPTAPSIRVVSINGIAVPDDPDSSFVKMDMTIATDQPVEVIVEAKYVPLDWKVQVRRVARSGPDGYVDCVLEQNSTLELSRWKTTMSFANGGHAVLARAFKP